MAKPVRFQRKKPRVRGGGMPSPASALVLGARLGGAIAATLRGGPHTRLGGATPLQKISGEVARTVSGYTPIRPKPAPAKLKAPPPEKREPAAKSGRRVGRNPAPRTPRKVGPRAK